MKYFVLIKNDSSSYNTEYTEACDYFLSWNCAMYIYKIIHNVYRDLGLHDYCFFIANDLYLQFTRQHNLQVNLFCFVHIVALQFPEGLLLFACTIADILER